MRCTQGFERSLKKTSVLFQENSYENSPSSGYLCRLVDSLVLTFVYGASHEQRNETCRATENEHSNKVIRNKGMESREIHPLWQMLYIAVFSRLGSENLLYVTEEEGRTYCLQMQTTRLQRPCRYGTLSWAMECMARIWAYEVCLLLSLDGIEKLHQIRGLFVP